MGWCEVLGRELSRPEFQDNLTLPSDLSDIPGSMINYQFEKDTI